MLKMLRAAAGYKRNNAQPNFPDVGTFVSVGVAEIATSPNGVDWTLRTNPATNSLNEVVSNTSNLFVAVGDLGETITSPDGITWTQRTNSASITMNGIRYLNSTFLGIRLPDGTLHPFVTSSSDGITWTQRTTPINDYSSYDIAYDGTSLYVFVGSDDGVDAQVFSGTLDSWTERTNPLARNLRGIAHNGTVFCAIGLSGYIITSTDGTTWTQRTASGAGSLHDIYWNGSIFVMVGLSYIGTSTDGINWTQQQSVGSFTCITYKAGTWVAGASGGGIYASLDATNWYEQTTVMSSAIGGVAAI